jgi:FlaA1/EpsC-like NDP-sugar epimerase
MLSEYEYLATNRHASFLSEDIENNRELLRKNICNSRIAVIGAAGSVGFAVVKALLQFNPRGIALIDISENNLVEVVRDIRSSANIVIPEDFAALPIAMGSPEFSRFFVESKPFDYIFNLCAIKHVRSEKDIYSLKRMIDTNILFLNDFLKSLSYPIRKFFSVSSDKATNPANLMGASKMAMEKILLHSQKHPFSTARFANVAFSDGSLPFGFLKRIEKRQPISAPNDVKRYFISHEEAGQICLLSCILGENGDVYFPHLKEGLDEITFSEIAVTLLEKLGYEPYECDSEEQAKREMDVLTAKKKWPCYFFKSDTTGEKDFEEFYGPEEIVDFMKYLHIGIIKQSPAKEDEKAIREFVCFASRAALDPAVTKADYVREIKSIVPTLHHKELGKNLDQKM